MGHIHTAQPGVKAKTSQTGFKYSNALLDKKWARVA
jgi:hypothetical protein